MTANSLKKKIKESTYLNSLYDVKVIVNDTSCVQFLLIDKAVNLIGYVIKYNKQLDTFSQIVGVFDSVDEHIIYYLNKLKTK